MPAQPTSGDWQSFWEAIRGGRRHVSARAEMGIPAQPRDRLAASRRRARDQEPGEEADTTLPEPRWNWISAPLSRINCRQKTAEQNYYNWFSRIETVRSWFKCWRKDGGGRFGAKDLMRRWGSVATNDCRRRLLTVKINRSRDGRMHPSPERNAEPHH
jgi:hypothetical protein